MSREPVSRDEFLDMVNNAVTEQQRKKVIAALIKIAVGIILLITGYFLPHSQ